MKLPKSCLKCLAAKEIISLAAKHFEHDFGSSIRESLMLHNSLMQCFFQVFIMIFYQFGGFPKQRQRKLKKKPFTCKIFKQFQLGTTYSAIKKVEYTAD